MKISFRWPLQLMIVLAVWAGWHLFSPDPFSFIVRHWEVTVTMVFGSLIAGGTSEGGGAVAFPVFTKLLGISPHRAKVFSLAIQSVGMTAASLTILLHRVPVEWRVIRLVTLGGLPGIVLGTVVIAPHLPPQVIRISFTAMLAGFAVTLLLLNRGIRNRNETIPHLTGREGAILLAAGLGGGVISGLVGNGIDIFAFSVIVLLFRLSEKVATPTSVILMALNALAGFAIHAFWLGDFTAEVRGYWLAAVPIVVVGAPLGAFLCRYLSGETIATILLALIALEVATSLLLIPLTPPVLLAGLGTFLFYLSLYYRMYRSRRYEPPLSVDSPPAIY